MLYVANFQELLPLMTNMEETREHYVGLTHNQDIPCDVILQINDKTFLAHRKLLASHSEYFAIMFKVDFKESAQETIVIGGVTINAMEQILQFVYTGCLQLEIANLFEVYGCADLLQFSVIKLKCASSMTNTINLDNCIDFLILSHHYNIDIVIKVAIEIICKHFSTYCDQNILFEQPYNVMRNVLSRNELICDSEIDVLRAICQWVSHHAGSPESMEGLLEEFRYGLVQPENLDNLSDEERVVLGDELIRRIEGDIIKLQSMLRHNQSLSTPHNRPRGETCLVVIGGNKTGPASMAVKAIMDHLDVICLNDQSQPSSYRNDKPSTCIRVSSNEKTPLPDVLTIPLPHPVTQCATVTVGNLLYLIGGYNSNGTLDTLHRFDPDYQSWTLLSPMLSGMKGHTAAVLGYCILVIGDHVEMYDIGEDKWTGKADVPGGPREKHAFVLSSQLYVCSHQQIRNENGFHGLNFVNVIHEYNAENDTWHKSLNQPSDRDGWTQDYTVCADEKFMYSLGGREAQFGEFIYNTVSKIDPTDGELEKKTLSVLPKEGVM